MELDRSDCYTEAEVAKYLNISVSTLRNRRSLGRDLPPSVKLGREHFYPMKEFKRWFEKTYQPMSPTLRAVV